MTKPAPCSHGRPAAPRGGGPRGQCPSRELLMTVPTPPPPSYRWLRPSASGKCGTLASSMWITKDFLRG